jgi:Zn-dependent protease
MDLSPEHLRWSLLQLILLVVSIGLHEFGHAWVADLRGDPLPRLQGRVTLNPLAHADPIGTLLIPGIMIFFSPGFGLIGWGKPVQISLPNPATRRMDDILISLAGPAMNLVLCLVFAFIGVVMDVSWANPATHNLGKFLVLGMLMNVGLLCFNLIPIPPLDGSRVLYRLGVYSLEFFTMLSRYSFIILIVLINLPGFGTMLWNLERFFLTPILAIWPGSLHDLISLWAAGR